MQGEVGRVLALEQRGGAYYKRIDNTFTVNNAVLINKLTDMLNLSSDNREGYNFPYCNRLIWLAACCFALLMALILVLAAPSENEPGPRAMPKIHTQ